MKKKELMKKFLSAALVLSMAVAPMLPAVRVNAAAAGGAYSMYTGEPTTADAAAQRPIAVMMPTDKVAQPSYGISNAKVLYEIMEEGDISRQLAVIDNWQGLEKIGNVRSCRLYYIPEAKEWDPILIHFGGVVYMKDAITAADVDNISGTSEYGVGGAAPGSAKFWRTTDRKAPHNAYISASGITAAAKELGYSLTVRQQYYRPNHFTFAQAGNDLSQYGAGAVSANKVDLSKVFPYTKSAFTYDPASGLYLKTLHGAAQKDGNNGQQLAFANIIIQSTKWSKADSHGYLSFQNIDNTEDGYFVTKGKAIHIHWIKTADHEPTKYYDDANNEIQLNVGKTYIAIAQKGRAPIFQ
ncbi:MAG: DUF3048 domain-containing protein [Lachnospiraceae bacterium]|nr:DUF3048 domain-containing protein [Lachnospiraceae bacterium]